LKYYFKVTFAPAASRDFFKASASSFFIPVLSIEGAASTKSLASLSPRPSASLTTLITPIFAAPPSVSSRNY
jgi:hypothetical protein